MKGGVTLFSVVLTSELEEQIVRPLGRVAIRGNQ
jgi:hypothetical protein